MTILAEERTYVAGQWVTGDEAVRVENPADETHVHDVTATPLVEVERAIAEARRSFDQGVWADLPAPDRARVLHEFVDYIEGAADTLVPTLVAEAGQPTRFAEMTQLRAGVGLARQSIDLYLSMTHEQSSPVPVDDLVRGRVALSIRRHEPVGVVTAITPYNAALIMGFQKLIPALMAGNSVILRPSPLTPISSLIFGMAAEAAGLPPGVLSVVVESGTAGAELLTSDPGVDMVSFTGSTLAGRKILAQAASTVKRVSLELGGKSAQIYLPDAIDRVAIGAAMVVMSTAGQACVAATRMLVPQDQKEQVLDAVSAMYRSIKVGPPTAPDATMGPVISAAQRERCERLVAAAEDNGGKVVCGGGRPEGLTPATTSSQPCSTFRTTPILLRRRRSSVRSSPCSGIATSTTPSRSPTTAPTGCQVRCTAPTWPPPLESHDACAPARSTSTRPSFLPTRPAVDTSRAASAANGVPTGSVNFRRSNTCR